MKFDDAVKWKERLEKAQTKLYWLYVAINMFTLNFLIMVMVLGTSVEPRWPLLADLIRFVLPGIPANLVDSAVKFPLQSIVLILVIWVMYMMNKQVKVEANELAFQIWQRIYCGQYYLLPKLSFIVKIVGWMAPPKCLSIVTVLFFALFLLILLLTLILSILLSTCKDDNDCPLSGVAINSPEMFCDNVRGPCRLGAGGTISVTIASNRKHNMTGIFVKGGETYSARFVSSEHWCDGNYPAKPGGVKFDEYVRFLAWWVKWLRPYPEGEWFQIVGRVDGSNKVFPIFHGQDDQVESSFKVPDNGELVLLVNDVWYRNNKGVMSIEIRRQ